MNQSIRIIGGQYRGKKLAFPVVDGLRPTPDRVRETLFNWLMNTIHDARCLDAYAGSGALGFEAFSRGAGKVVLIEQAPMVYSHLKKIVAGFNSPKLTLVNKDASAWMQQTKEQFDIIFLDPPFSQNHLPDCISIIENTPLLALDGLLYIESPHEMALDWTMWEQVKLKKAGQVVYGLYKRHANQR